MKEESLFKFSEFDIFYDEYKPLTPFGKKEKYERKIYHDAKILENEFFLLEKVINFIKENNIRTDRIESYLKRIPEIEENSFCISGSVDIFLFKKFLINYKKIYDLISEDLKNILSVHFYSDELINLLNIGGSSEETFYLSEKYSEELANIRKKIFDIDEKIADIKNERKNKILSEFGIDFFQKDFQIIEEKKGIKLNKNYFFIEHFDKNNFIIKPVYPKELFHLYAQKEGFLEIEKNIEKSIINKISEEINKEKENILYYIEVIKKIDILFAKAKLSINFNLRKPLISDYGDKIYIKNGIFIPLKTKCDKANMLYYPLNVEFDKRNIVIHGSNMGGKTVLLKSILFLQLLTQMGFFVPAECFRTVLFEEIFFIGDDSYDFVEGLSSFGLEINTFNVAYKMIEKKCLFIMDEFARTTNSIEAVSLLSAILYDFNKRNNVYSFISTHFMNLKEFGNVSFYKMKGLNYSEYKKYFSKEISNTIEDRIKIINSFMNYEVIKDIYYDMSFDALNIAGILGINEEILKNAKENINLIIGKEKKE